MYGLAAIALCDIRLLMLFAVMTHFILTGSTGEILIFASSIV